MQVSITRTACIDAWSCVSSMWNVILGTLELERFEQDIFTTATPSSDSHPAPALALFGRSAFEVSIFSMDSMYGPKMPGASPGRFVWKALGKAILSRLVLMVPTGAIIPWLASPIRAYRSFWLIDGDRSVKDWGKSWGSLRRSRSAKPSIPGKDRRRTIESIWTHPGRPCRSPHPGRRICFPLPRARL